MISAIGQILLVFVLILKNVGAEDGDPLIRVQ